jgi:CheY-like chemotaxis protein
MTTDTLRAMRVVIVEDDDATRLLLESVLTIAGASVTTARDPSAALDCLDEVAPDAVLIDLNLRSGAVRHEGLTLLRWLRQRPTFDRTAVVLTSAYVEELPAEVEDCDAILAKPFSIDDLPQLLLRLTRQRGAAHAPCLADPST